MRIAIRGESGPRSTQFIHKVVIEIKAVRCKFKCHSVYPNGVVNLYPVHSGSEENKTFWDATPAGTICLTITNPAARDRFEAGKEYYVDFTPAE